MIRIILLLVFISSELFAQQTEIKINFKGTKDTLAVLGYYYGKDKYIEDTTVINTKGEAVFSKTDKYNTGMYFVALPQTRNIFFSFLIGKQQKFNITAEVTENHFKNIGYKNSEINDHFNIFNDSLNSIGRKFQKYKSLFTTPSLAKEEKSRIKDTLKNITENKNIFLRNAYKTEKNTSLKAIIGLIIEPEVPKINIPENVQNKDSFLQMKQYYYYKNHYWDNVDFEDETIIRTAFFIPKFEKYISKILIQNPDTLVNESIKLIEKARGNIQAFAYMINYMLTYNEKVKFMGMDKIFVEIGKKYYVSGDAVWSDSAYIAKITEKVFRTEPNLIGQKAPAINGVYNLKNKPINMYDIDAEYLIIIFWEPSCGHCKTEVPKLYEIYTDLIKKGIDVEVIAMLGDKDTTKWRTFIKEKNIKDWVNVWDKNWNSNFKIFYDIYSTPTIYVLDRKKKIIAKRITSEQVKVFIEGKENQNKK